MTLATMAWGVVWIALGAHKFGAEIEEEWIYGLASVPALLGLCYSLMSLRAKRAWVFMTLVALFANGSLLALPWVFGPEFTAAMR